ncbi:MAG: nuclear transport factor 2 family protein [Dermatophilaceae bacterium]
MPATDPARTPTDILEPLLAYARGHATGDVSHFETAFLPTAHVEGLLDGRLTSWDLDAYRARVVALYQGRPAPDEDDRVRTIDHVNVVGTVATATMTLRHGSVTFTDMFVLLDIDGRWRIANKVYHRHEEPSSSAA